MSRGKEKNSFEQKARTAGLFPHCNIIQPLVDYYLPFLNVLILKLISSNL